MLKIIKRISAGIILALFIFASFSYTLADSLPEDTPEEFGPEGFKSVYIDEEGRKIIYESKDEDDDTEIGIDYSVDLGEDEEDFVDFGLDQDDDTFIKVDGEVSLEKDMDKPKTSPNLALVLGLPLACLGAFVWIRKKHKYNN